MSNGLYEAIAKRHILYREKYKKHRKIELWSRKGTDSRKANYQTARNSDKNNSSHLLQV